MSLEFHKLKLIDKSSEYKGFFSIDRLSYQHTLFRTGSMSEVIDREVFKRGQAVVVLLYDINASTFVLVEQCRAGCVEASILHDNIENAWTLEPVAGMIDGDEPAHYACQREVHEEVGLDIGLDAFEYVCQFYPSPGGSDEILHLFAAEVDSSSLDLYGGLANEVEDIRIVKLPFNEAQSLMAAGEINVASTIIALQWFFLKKLA